LAIFCARISPTRLLPFANRHTQQSTDDAGRSQAFSCVHRLTRAQAVNYVVATMRFRHNRTEDSGRI
jgi:hypothetical protein